MNELDVYLHRFGFECFQGFLNDLQDWELSLKDKDKKIKQQRANSPNPVCSCTLICKLDALFLYPLLLKLVLNFQSSENFRPSGSGQYDFLKNYHSVRDLSSSLIGESLLDSNSEKEQVLLFFKLCFFLLCGILSMILS